MKAIAFRRSLVVALTILLVGALIVPSNGSTNLDLDSGLVGYWSFNEGSGGVVYDYSGNGNDGIIYGAGWTDGVSGWALDFDGSDDYVDYGDILNDVYLPFTVAGWIFKEGTTEASIFTSDDQTTPHRYYGFWFAVQVDYQVEITYGDGGPASVDYRRSKVSSLTVPVEDWTHVAAVVRGPTDMTIYIDGVDAGGTYSGTGGPMRHGSAPARTGLVWTYYAGDIIDEVRVYSRELSETEIEDLYSNPAEPPVVMAGPDTDPEDGVHDSSPFACNDTIYFEGIALAAGGGEIGPTMWVFDDVDTVVIYDEPYDTMHQFTDLSCNHIAVFTAWDSYGSSASDTLLVHISTNGLPEVHSVSAMYDGITNGDTIGIFISGFSAKNTFYASASVGDCQPDSVVFEVGDTTFQGTYCRDTGLWVADSIGLGCQPPGDNLLKVRAYDCEGLYDEKTAIIRMRGIPDWYSGSWLQYMEHHEENEFVTTDGTPYYQMEVSIPEPPVQWGAYDFSVDPFFPDLVNHLKVYLGIQGRFYIEGHSSDFDVSGDLIAKILGEGLDEQISVDPGDMDCSGPYGDLVAITMYRGDYEIANTNVGSYEGTLMTFTIGLVPVQIKYSADFGLQAHIPFGADMSVDIAHTSYLHITPTIEPWVSLDVWASALFGVAELGMNFTPTFGLEFPCTLYIYPEYYETAHYCAYFELCYSVWAALGWGYWKSTLYDDCDYRTDEPIGCHWGKYEIEGISDDIAMIGGSKQPPPPPKLPPVPKVIIPPPPTPPWAPQMAVVWIHDEDTTEIDPEVYCSFFTAGTEWNYGPITDNDRWETNPMVAILSSDSVIAVWTQNEIPKADWDTVQSLSTVLNNQELYYSIWTNSKGDWIEPINITLNSVPDGCSDLAAGMGKAILVWVRDRNANPLNTEWDIFYSWYDNGSWSDTVNLSDMAGSDFQPSVAVYEDSGWALVSWTHDEDCDLNTPDDRHIYYSYVGLTKGESPFRADIPHEMGPLNPSVDFAPGGNPVIAYSSRSVVWDSVNGEWDTLGVGFEDRLCYCYYQDETWYCEKVIVDGAEIRGMNPIVRVDDQNRAMIVYRGFEGEGIAGFDGEIFSVYIDLDSRTPPENLVQYTSDTVTTWMLTFDMNGEGNGKLVYVSYQPEPPDSFGDGLDNMYITTPEWSSFLRGDANGDGAINIADVVHLVNYLFTAGSAPEPLWVGDANCDGVVDIADVIYLVNYLFTGGDPPGC